MLHTDALKDLLSQSAYSKSDKLLLCLAEGSAKARRPKDIRTLATSAGLRSAAKWEISKILSASPYAISTTDGWELTSVGRAYVRELAGPLAVSAAPSVASELRSHLGKVKDADTRGFVEEAIGCLETGLLRAAVVLSWVGAMSLLQSHIHGAHLAAFNAEASRRHPKWRPAKSKDDLARMKESELLAIAEGISVIGKSVRQELDGCLTFRNGCGHPNSLRIGSARVTAHVETLIQNVFSRF